MNLSAGVLVGNRVRHLLIGGSASFYGSFRLQSYP